MLGYMPNHAIQPQTEEAFAFYKDAILGPVVAKRAAARDYGFTRDSVSSKDWEIFDAILLDRQSSGKLHGSDLQGVEVKSAGFKSATSGSSFEYQYHRNHGLEKLLEDAHIHHVFVSYSPDYTNVIVRLLRPDQVHDTIRSWRKRYIGSYSTSSKGGRCRPGLTYASVVARGTVLLEIRDGQMVQANEDLLADLLAEPAACTNPGCLADQGKKGIANLSQAEIAAGLA
jgi:hypothetical protein